MDVMYALSIPWQVIPSFSSLQLHSMYEAYCFLFIIELLQLLRCIRCLCLDESEDLTGSELSSSYIKRMDEDD